jgi:hypothetical protein
MRKTTLLVGLVSMLAVSTADAQPTLASGPAPGSTLIDFNSLGIHVPIATQWAPAVTIGSSCFISDNAFNSWFGGDPMQAANFDALRQNCNGSSTLFPPVTFAFSAPINYFGLFAIALNDVTLTEAHGGIIVNATATNPTATFVGLNDAAGFSSVTISADQDGSFVVDNVTFGTTVVAVPEPASLVLLAAGMLAVGVFAKRNRSTM